LGATAASITFSGIPGGFNNLQVSFLGQTDFSTDNPYLSYPQLLINGDTGPNYDWAQGYFYYGGAIGGFYPAVNYYQLGGINGDIDGYARGCSMNIFINEYTNTIFTKNLTSNSNGTTTTTGFAFYTAGSWNSTAVITELTLLTGGGSFIPGTTARLYGY